MTVGFQSRRHGACGRRTLSFKQFQSLLFRMATGLKRGLICLAALALLGCGSQGSGSGAVAASVNGQAITEGEFQQALARRKAALGEKPPVAPGAESALEHRVLEELIVRRLLLQEAARRGVSASADEVERRIQELSGSYDPDEYQAILREQGLTPDSFRAMVAEDLTMELLMEQAAGQIEAPGQEEVEAYFREHAEGLRRPFRARALHLVVASAEDAARLREAILKGEDFAEVARRHSLGPEADQNGDLGWRSPGELPEAFDDAIFSLKAGEVSPVVASPFGYHLFKLLEVKESGTPSLDEARPYIVAQLKEEAREARQQRWLEELRAKAEVVVSRKVQEESR